ncbi:MAG: hypothetical protein M0P64_02685 [Candidatus Pacebacteria bacterium]|jgi:hypothetical protein|nr:hypothetical protein [Candidatus Paceibacterota bacterium]
MKNIRAKIETRKYVLAFVITVMVFFGALIISNRFSENRIAEIKAVESKISLDILSSETQFALLKESSCKAIDHSTAFSEELSSLAAKLSYMEENLGDSDAAVTNLKKYYSLLQIKDYLLTAQVEQKCGIKPLTIIYFYSNKDGECEDCRKEGYVLTKLREEFPEFRVYSFDYNLDLSAVKTMKSIHGVQNKLPALIISDEPYYGFKTAEDLEKIIPQLKKLRAEHEKAAKAATATSTKK